MKNSLISPFVGESVPWIVKDQFDHPLHGNDVIGLDLMIVPGLHHLGIGRRDVHLAELQEEVIIRPEDLHHPPPFIRNDPQQFGLYAVNHLPL